MKPLADIRTPVALSDAAKLIQARMEAERLRRYLRSIGLAA